MEISVSSKNNSRKYNGTLHIGNNGPSVHRIKVDYYEYEIKITENELNSNFAFCKGVVYDPCESSACALDIRFEGQYSSLSIDPNALKSLIGWKVQHISEIILFKIIITKFTKKIWNLSCA